MRKIAIFIISTLLFSYTLPFASAVTETQFSDGTTTFTRVFSQSGEASTPGVTMPYGADVESVEFEVEGSASTTTWFNRTTDAEFGGAGQTGSSQQGWSINQNGWYYGYRTNVLVENDEVQLRPTDTTSYWSLSNQNDVASSSGGSLNTTGQYFSSAEAGYNGIYDTRTMSLSGGTWGSYMGPVVKQGDELHVIRYGGLNSAYGGYLLSAINRYNATTGASLGTATISYNNCTSTNVYYVSDATSDGDGVVWMASFYTSTSYAYITKWTVNSGTYSCERSWQMLEVGGISFDPSTNDMYIVNRVRVSNQYNMELWKVSRSQPNIALQSWSLGTISPSGGMTQASSYVRPAGLDVQMPRISVNIYCYYYTYTYSNCDENRLSWVNVYHQRPNWPELQGEIPSSYAIFGIEQIDDDLAATCFYAVSTAYCPSSTSRKILKTGDGAANWMGTPSSNSATITSSIKTLNRPVNQLKLGLISTWEPTGTSVDFEITNDGGTTWKRANSAGQTINFVNNGTQLAWRAWLNGTSTAAPLIDTVGLSYSSVFTSSGQVRLYRLSSATYPVAAQLWWNESTPGGSSIDVYFRTGTSCTSGTRINVAKGTPISFTTTSGYLSLCFDFDAGTNNEYSPTLYDFNVLTYADAPKNVKIDIGGDNSNEWQYQGTLIGTVTAQSPSASGSGAMEMVDAFNDIIPGTGSGTIVIPVKIRSDDAGTVKIKSMRIEYTMPTINLDINYDENMIFHERGDSYEIVTRHIIGDQAISIDEAELTILASGGVNPELTWTYDGSLVADDPEGWIVADQSGTWTQNSNGIFEIHWKFRVTDDFPEQENVAFRVSCTDDNNFSPQTLSSGTSSNGVRVNQSYGLGWLAIRDVNGDVTNNDLQNGDWVVAGETIHFQGQVLFVDSQDAPLDNTFDVQVARKDSQGDLYDPSWRDTSNPNGSFFISLQVPDMNIPEGRAFEIQTFNEKDKTKVMPITSSWRRTLRIDDSPPIVTENRPVDYDYEASSTQQQISITVDDAVGHPENLTLHYWVEADHDSNRNGVADSSEYVNQTMTNLTEAEEKVFFGFIDDSRNPNMARVSYFVSGFDPAGNSLISDSSPGFDYDLATYRTRKDMPAAFTGLSWHGHVDGADVFSGTDQSITVGLVDANGIIDFEYIALIFDFEGPNPERDQQRIWYDGRNDIWDFDETYLEFLQSSQNIVTTNESGLPWIMITYDFRFSWDWPDEDVSDLALEYKELGSQEPTRIEFDEYTFSVENDLVLDTETYLVQDVAEPRLGVVDDATPVRPDDRLRWSGRVVYEDSNTPAPSDLGITVEVFDGVQYWSDGSLTDEGGFSIEVPLTAASTLQSAETRTFISGIRNVPGRGEDMTRDTVATTLQLHVDHTPPRVHHRLAPIDVIDISAASDLSRVPVHFVGWEECVLIEDADRCASLGQSPQWVNWVMRDEARTIAAGQSQLSMQVLEDTIEWIGEVDLTSGGVVTPRSGYRIGFWITGHDAAGNEFPMATNTESDPVRERSEIDGDYELAWVRLGATVAELMVKSLTLEKDTLSEGTDVEITTVIVNNGGETESSFTVQFIADGEVFDSEIISGLPKNTELLIKSTWTAEKGVDRITVVVDSENDVVEVDEDGNSMSVGVSVEYSWGMGWIDSWRQNPLTVIGVIFAMILLPIIATVTWKTSLSGSYNLYDEELHFDDDDDEDDWEDDEDDWE